MVFCYNVILVFVKELVSLVCNLWKQRLELSYQLLTLISKRRSEIESSAYIPCIMIDSEICSGKFGLAEALMSFICLVHFLCKCLMGWLRKHAAKEVTTFWNSHNFTFYDYRFFFSDCFLSLHAGIMAHSATMNYGVCTIGHSVSDGWYLLMNWDVLRYFMGEEIHTRLHQEVQLCLLVSAWKDMIFTLVLNHSWEGWPLRQNGKLVPSQGDLKHLGYLWIRHSSSWFPLVYTPLAPSWIHAVGKDFFFFCQLHAENIAVHRVCTLYKRFFLFNFSFKHL